MDILILNWKDIKHPQVGGAEIIVYELAKRLVRDGHNVTWFSKGTKPEEIVDGIKMIRRGNLVTTYLYAPLYYWSLKHKPDLVIDMSNTIFWQTPIWAWKSKKIAYLNQFAKEVFFYEFPPIISHFGYLIERLQYLTYYNTKFICYSSGTRSDLIEAGIPDVNISQFSLGLDRGRYTPGKKSTFPLFITVNRLVKMKRTDLVIRAMGCLVKKYPKAKLVIIGTGYERENLQELRDRLELQNNINFADESIWFFAKDQRDKKLTLMQQAWALVLPSVKEGWGMVVTECAACGTPTIATNVTGLSDSVLDGKTGLLVSENPTAEELAAAMERLIVDLRLRKKFGINALAFSKRFTWENSYQGFMKILRSLSLSVFILFFCFVVPVSAGSEEKTVRVDSFEMFWPLVAGKTQGDKFYQLKVLKENVRGAIIFGPVKKAEYNSFLATKRLLEAEKLLSLNKDELANSSLQSTIDHLNTVKKLTQTLNQMTKDNLVKINKLSNYLMTLHSSKSTSVGLLKDLVTLSD